MPTQPFRPNRFTFSQWYISVGSFASELRTSKGQLWASIWFKNGSGAWNEPPGANQLTPLPPLLSLTPTTPGSTACAGPVWSLFSRFFVIPGHAAADLTSPVKTSKWGVICEVPHLQGPSDLLCTPFVTGVAVVMPQMHCWRLAVAKPDIFLCFFVLNTRSSCLDPLALSGLWAAV
jgi:hypothetical protein